MHAQAEEYGVADAIEFAEFVPYEELPKVYASHDCFVYPGIWDEPLARVYLECFAAGTPVVTSEYGSIEEIVGDAGRVTDGSPAGFRDALLDIVAKGELEAMSSAAKYRVAEFELSKIIGEIEKMYADIDSRDRLQPKTP
jgi:glycosyltransferase involved in cell wall biosynthesis